MCIPCQWKPHASILFIAVTLLGWFVIETVAGARLHPILLVLLTLAMYPIRNIDWYRVNTKALAGKTQTR